MLAGGPIAIASAKSLGYILDALAGYRIDLDLLFAANLCSKREEPPTSNEEMLIKKKGTCAVPNKTFLGASPEFRSIARSSGVAV